MKKKYKNLFKNSLKYLIFFSSLILLWNYAFQSHHERKMPISVSKSEQKNTVFDPSSQEDSLFYPKIELPILINNLENLNLFNQFQYNNSIVSSFCPFISPFLIGKINVNENVLNQFDLEEKFSNEFGPVSGGHWRPKDCVAQSKVAIIVPYRDRNLHLRLFLNHMHSFLRKQLIEYAIYIIEEVATIPFNRAVLMNIGYKEAIKDNDWDCFVFHDVDLVPEDDRNLYHCPYYPRHMSSNVNTFGYILPYKEILGGVTAIRRKHFEKVNGFSNSYFGWGGEGNLKFFQYVKPIFLFFIFFHLKDDDFAERVLSHNLKIIRYPDYISRYFMLAHKKDIPSKQRFNLLESAKKRFKTDGLNSLKYQIEAKDYKRLFTWVLVSFEYPNKID